MMKYKKSCMYFYHFLPREGGTSREKYSNLNLYFGMYHYNNYRNSEKADFSLAYSHNHWTNLCIILFDVLSANEGSK